MQSAQATQTPITTHDLALQVCDYLTPILKKELSKSLWDLTKLVDTQANCFSQLTLTTQLQCNSSAIITSVIISLSAAQATLVIGTRQFTITQGITVLSPISMIVHNNDPITVTSLIAQNMSVELMGQAIPDAFMYTQ